ELRLAARAVPLSLARLGAAERAAGDTRTGFGDRFLAERGTSRERRIREELGGIRLEHRLRACNDGRRDVVALDAGRVVAAHGLVVRTLEVDDVSRPCRLAAPVADAER